MRAAQTSRRPPERRTPLRSTFPRRPYWRRVRPGQVVALGFAGAVLVGTGLLMLPAATASGDRAPAMVALFTATSAVCVTGHVVVDTPTYWSHLGQVVILVLIQVGGIGVMSVATLLGLLVARRLGLRARLNAANETHSVERGDVARVLRGVLTVALVVEAVVAVVLTLRWVIAHDVPLGQALWWGVFHAVSSFNNAGFALFSDSLMSWTTDPWLVLPISASVVLGGLGFAVVVELLRRFRLPRTWSLGTVTVLVGTVALLVLGTVAITALEWRNPATLGAMTPPDRVLSGFVAAVMPRTAGFNNLDIGAMDPVTWLVIDVLMFVGAGPASTAGGVKITTFAVLFFIILTELRGEAAVNMFGKRLPRSTHREALTVALLSVALVVASTGVIMLLTPHSLDRVLFEVISAFATVGLSTGITASLPPAAQLVLVVLMFIGRLGPVALGTALALRRETRRYELPKERPIIG